MIAPNRCVRVMRQDIEQVQAPEFTSSWTPYPHAAIITQLEGACNLLGVKRTAETYSMTKDGSRIFGVWNIVSPTFGEVNVNGIEMCIGFRNSIDKSIALGITAGTHVIVCSNMQISGEYLRIRKHTGGLDPDELESLIATAVIKCLAIGKRMVTWHRNLHDIPMTRSQMDSFILRSIEPGILRPAQIPDVVEHLDKSLNETQEGSLYTAHAAITRTFRDTSLFNVAARGASLERYVNDYLNSADMF